MWLQLVFLISLLFFVSAFVVKAVKYARMPIHLRWELYPVAHEIGHGSGGSYLEEMNWWTKPLKRSLFGEIKYMVREGLLFEKCYRNNRGLWYFTYSFHMGLFLLIGWLLLLLSGALILMSGASVSGSASAWTMPIYYLTMGVGIAGFVLATFGCTGLIIKRSTDEDLRLYTAPRDYFNLVFVLAILVSGLSSWYFFDRSFTTAREFIKSLITYSPEVNTNPAMLISIFLFSLFLVYMPFTPMMHGLAKYFTYHRVFWEDEPNLPGSKMEDRVRELLGQPISWSASHIRSIKTWSDVVSEGSETE